MDDNLVTSTYDSKHPTVEGGIAAIPKIFTSHFVMNNKQRYAYRPVATSSFAIEYQFFGQNPTASHFFNILLYALSIIVLFRALNQMWGEEKYVLTVLTCLIFLIHPIHTEVVNNIKSRDELLSFLFGILALKQALNFADRNKIVHILWSLLFVTLSLLSKKTGFIFVAVIPLTLYYFRTLNAKRFGILVAGLLFGIVIFKITGKLLLDESVSRVKQYFENPLYYEGFKDRIPMFFYSNYYYLALLIFPYPLRYYYGFDQVPIADWSNPIVYLMIILMIFAVGITLIRIKKKEIWAYGLLFYFLAIGGACNLLFPAVGIIAERFAFIASLGLCISLSYLIYYFFYTKNARFSKHQKTIKFGIIVLSITSLVYVFGRNQDWKTDSSLYKHDIKYLENSYKAHNLLGQHYYKQALNLLQSNQPPASYFPKVDSAEIEFKKCLSLYDGYAVTYNNLGALNYTFKKQEDTAYYFFTKALHIDTNYAEALFNLGNIEMNKYWSYYNLHNYVSQIQDTLHPKSAPAVIQSHHKELVAIGKLLQDIKVKIPAIINNSGNQSNSQQDFLLNLQKNVLGYLKSISAVQWFNEEEFKIKLQTNGQGVIQSYEDGLLTQHLFNFVAFNIANNLLSTDGLSELNRTSVANWCATQMKSYEGLMLSHFYKCIEVNPSYYPAFQYLNQYYFDLSDYKNILSLNQKMVDSESYPYQYEFYNNIAKAYYFQNELDSSKHYLELTLEEIELFISENPESNTSNLMQYKQSVQNQLNQINQNL